MIELRDSLGKIIILLLISSFFLAALHSTNRVGAGNEVSADGAIEVYDSDGKKPLTDYDFPLFTGGTAETFLKEFFINNTGNQPTAIYWNVTTSSIPWEVRSASYPDAYDYHEEGIWKYSFGIHQECGAPVDYWHPDGEAVFLDAYEGVKLRFELHYTGEPNTAETFTMTISFYAMQTSTIRIGNGGGGGAEPMFAPSY